jgi:DNA helicase-2/ATP-dependent DNA helicase PcrA
MHCLTLFTTCPDVLEEFRNRFRYILVDEYQDTNVSQYLWLRLLAGSGGNICCVGDDDQSIFSWRGAEVGNILRFEKDFPNATVIRLERNYRSTPHILAAASAVIANNSDRLGKTLWTEISDGEKIQVRSVWDGEEEARTVCDEIEDLQRKKVPLSEMAILVRAGFQTREFEERLITLGIPYKVIGGPRFYERMEIRDAIAYLRLAAQPDDDLAYERIINKPKRGLGPATMREVHMLARAKGVSLFHATRLIVETEELKPKARKTLAGLVEDFERWRTLLAGMPPGELAATVLDESGYTELWQFDKSPEAPGRLENLKEFVNALEEFDSIEGFLEHISLVMENDEADDIEKVTVMTLHAAKGLEFDTVFLVGWEEGLFPHQRALDESGVAGLEEERRLAYVGITRAKRLSKIFHAANRRIYNQWQSSLPSRFIDELPAENIERRSDMGFRDMQAGGWGWTPAPQRRAGLAGRGKVIDTEWEVAERPMPKSAYAVGERVFHQKFGYGAVLAVEDNRLEIDFEKAGIKKVIDSFVERP